MRHLTRAEVIALLRRSALFRGLDDAELDALAAKAQPAEFSAGQIIVRRGERGEALMVLASGHAKIVTTSQRGAELMINIIEPGGILGELALLDGGERSADAIALEDVELVRLPRGAFLGFLEAHPRVAIQLLAVLSEKLRRTTEVAENAAFLDLPTRLYRRLLALARLYGETTDHGVRIHHKMPQKDLASSIGASRESVNKQLQSWCHLGFLETGAGYALIKDLAALSREVEGHSPLTSGALE